jgi:hypothetical protein
METIRAECFGGRHDGELLEMRDEPHAVVSYRDGEYRRLGPNAIAIFVPQGGLRRKMNLFGWVRSCTCGRLVIGGGEGACSACRDAWAV